MGGVVSAVTQDYHNRKAASAGRAGYAKAADEIRAGKTGALDFYDPYVQLGQEALSPLTGLALGRQYDPETGEFTDLTADERLALFQESPDYQFRLEQGLEALEASQAARGGLLSGRALREAQALGQDIAAGEYQGYINRLQGLAGMGQQAAGASANVMTGTASQLAQGHIGVGQLQAQMYQQRGQLYGEAGQQATGAALGAAFPGQGAGGGSFMQRFGQQLGGEY